MARIHLAIPCFNPTPEGWSRLKDYLGDFQRQIKAPLTVTIVDDGSMAWVDPPDFSKEKLTVQLLRQTENKGKGAAIKRAVSCLSDETAVFAFTDFDVPYSIDSLVGVCAAVATGSAEICIGDRVFYAKDGSHSKKSRQIFHRIFRFFVRTIVSGGILDSQCGLKAYCPSAARTIAAASKIDGFLFDLEWIYIALRHGLCVRQWPVFLEEHHKSSSLSFFLNYRILKDGTTLLKNILSRNYDSEQLHGWIEKRRQDIAAALR